MKKIKSPDDLRRIKEDTLQENSTDSVLIKIGMSTCGIASGAREIMNILREECEFQAIDAQFKQTGCLGFCYAEPIVEVQLPGTESKVFGYVDKKRAKEIVENYIIKREQVENEITVSFRTIND